MYSHWSGQQMKSLIALDTETTMIDGYAVPDLVIMQAHDGDKSYIISADNITTFLQAHKQSEFIFHNAAFDIAVLNAYFDFHDHIENSKVHDTQILYKLWLLSTSGEIPFKSNLKLVAKELVGMELDKDEGIRCNFGDFLNKDAREIPKEFLEYAILDVIATFKIYDTLRRKIMYSDSYETNLSEGVQIAGSIALDDMYRRGIQIDHTKRDELFDQFTKSLDASNFKMAYWGVFKGKKGFDEKLRHANDLYNIGLPTTDSGKMSIKESDLKDINHPLVQALLEYTNIEKAMSFVSKITDDVVHPRYNLLMRTGRTSCSNPNFQQLPKSFNIRHMFVPREGKKFLITDYSAIELATLSQTTYSMYGKSVMRDMINHGIDLHKYYASVLLDKKIEDVTKAERQSAKACNFGWPGGLGLDTFVTFAKASYGLEVTRKQAGEMKDAWFEAFPEMKDYMEERKEYAYTLTGRLRGNCSYCASKNTPFQGLASDGAKIALYYLYHKNRDLIGFVHDEIITECYESQVTELLAEQEQIMIDAMSNVTPDVKIAVESNVTDYYTK